jgi:hypothetical protein
VAGNVTDTVDIVMAQPCWANALHKGSQSIKFPSDIENALLLLDEGGEWYGDFSAHVIYYKPRDGETIDTLHAVLGSDPKGVEGAALVLLPGSQNLRIRNLAFKYQSWSLPSSDVGFVDLQSGFFYLTNPGPLHGVPGAVAVHGAKGVQIDNCTFAHLGLSGVVVDGGSQNVTVSSSTFTDTSGSAVSLGNVSNAVLADEKQDGWYSIHNNYIRNTGAEYHGCAGILAGYVAHTDIIHNDIASTSNGAICLGWGWGATNSMRNNRVSYNRIVRSNTDLFDCGSIYTLSAQPGSEVAYNYIENQVLLYGSLYHDARSAYFHTHHNVVVGGPMWLYLQWGTLGPVDNLLIENNFHNQTAAGGCAVPEHAATCKATGLCPTKYSPCGNVSLTNNTLVKGAVWPAEALSIKAAAGIAHVR